MKCCVSTDVGTWTNWLTFEADPDYSRMLEPDCFLRYRVRCNAEFYYVGKIPHYAYWRSRSLQRGVVLKWFLFTASRGNTVVGGIMRSTEFLKRSWGVAEVHPHCVKIDSWSQLTISSDRKSCFCHVYNSWRLAVMFLRNRVKISTVLLLLRPL